MHEQHGYDVLAFEAGMFDCERSQEVIDSAPTSSATATDAMRTCLFPLWNTTTARALFDYVRSTHDTASPLRVTGFDVQFSGSKSTERARRTAASVARTTLITLMP